MAQTESQPPANSPRWVLIALGFALAAACIVFTLRGPGAAVRPGGNYDLTLIYSSARAWLYGGNPYDRADVSQAWSTSRGSPDLDPMIVRGPATLVYPPTAFAILAPVAALPWPIASWVWAVLNTALAALSLTALARLASLRGAARLTLLTLGMFLAPLALNAKQGQTAVVVLACICVATLARNRSRPALSGVLLGIGAALKPQVGFLFVVYEAGRLRWKPVAYAACAIAALTVVGSVRMSAAGVDWWPAWQANLEAFTTIDDANATRSNPIRHQVINLHYPLHNFTDDRDVVRFAVYGIVGALCAAYFIVDLKRRRQATDVPAELTSLSFVSAVTLMVAYHRPYDAAILILPLTLAVSRLFRTPGFALHISRRHLVTLALVLLHALPLPILITEAARRGHLPQSLLDSAIGQNLLLPCQAYGLLVLAIWLIWTRWADTNTPVITQRPT